ncbi:OadG family protein [Treponema pedis]|nr:OadG family protein [Treponema pedis]
MKGFLTENGYIGITEAVYITSVSMAVVFVVLILISLIVSFMKYIPKEKTVSDKKLKKETDTNTGKHRINYGDEKIRVAAAVAAMEAAGEKDGAVIHIRSVKELGEIK